MFIVSHAHVTTNYLSMKIVWIFVIRHEISQKTKRLITTRCILIDLPLITLTKIIGNGLFCSNLLLFR